MIDCHTDSIEAKRIQVNSHAVALLKKYNLVDMTRIGKNEMVVHQSLDHLWQGVINMIRNKKINQTGTSDEIMLYVAFLRKIARKASRSDIALMACKLHSIRLVLTGESSDKDDTKGVEYAYNKISRQLDLTHLGGPTQ